MSTQTTVECDGPGCQISVKREGGFNDGVIRAIARAQGWAVRVMRTPDMPDYLPHFSDLCPIHRGLAKIPPKRPPGRPRKDGST